MSAPKLSPAGRAVLAEVQAAEKIAKGCQSPKSGYGLHCACYSDTLGGADYFGGEKGVCCFCGHELEEAVAAQEGGEA